MSKKMYWGIATLILIIGAVGFLFYRQNMEIEQPKKEAAKEDKVLEQQQTPGGVVEGELDTSHPDFHIHEDGTPHTGRHDEPKAQYTAPEGAVLKPDFPKVDPKEDPVKAAYKRLEYIKNNPYAWGGVHSPRATELITELMPARLPTDHNESDERELLIYELCEQGDPRAAEALIAITCDGGVKSVDMDDALEEIGPPAVPYILPYLERENRGETQWIYIDWEVFDSLTRIGVRYRDDLGSIVQHIIIPKFEEIAADKESERYHPGAVNDAREALIRLR